jgi:hypothetical protein
MVETLHVDEESFQDTFYDNGWTDGLPVIAPTQARVEAMLSGGGVGPEDPLGGVASQQLVMTAEHAAINAVMAGCEPVAFPIVLTALSACLDPTFNLPVVCTSTGGSAICVIVSGPMAEAVGMHSGHNALGPSSRANATIGRAIRLASTNFLGSRTQGTDGTSLGHPGKYTFCFAEQTPPDPWDPLRVDLGYGIDDTTVTVFPAEAPRQVANHLNSDPDGIVATLASALRTPFHFAAGKGGAQFVVVVGPEHAGAVTAAHWTRQQVAAAIHAQSRISPEEIAAAGVTLELGSHHDMRTEADGKLTTVRSPEDILVVTAGGAGGGWSAVIAAWAPLKHSQYVTRRVRETGEALPPCGPDGCTVNWD